MRHLIKALHWLMATVLWCVIVSVLWVALLGVLDPPVTWTMVVQSQAQQDLHRTNRRLEDMARHMPLAVIASEDQRFFHHSGFEWERMREAMDHNARKKGKRVRGASTITQQVVKNVFLWPDRTYVRKAVEMWFTVLVEALWSKERILEVYLNVAEMGKGVFGVEAAARQCFGRSAATLTPAQCALLTATLPAPRRYSCSKVTPYLTGRQQWVLRQMRNIGDQMDPEVRRRIGEKIDRERRIRDERPRKRS